MYRGLYINLDRDVVRRKHMEAEFERFGLSKNYQRLRAVQNELGAVGCLRSHLKALDLVRRQDALVHILEDDFDPVGRPRPLPGIRPSWPNSWRATTCSSWTCG